MGNKDYSFWVPFHFNEAFKFILNRKNRILSFGLCKHSCIGSGIAIDFCSEIVLWLYKNFNIVSININEISIGTAAIGTHNFDIEIYA